MKTLTRVLLGAAVILMMGLSACSSDEPTPTPIPEPDIPVMPEMPEHPDKDWKGEFPHGFITDATVIGLPISERGYIKFDGNDEIVIDPDIEPTDWGGMSDTPKRAKASWEKYCYMTLDGKTLDPFENQQEYIQFCTLHKFRPKSQFSNFEELMGFKTPIISGYFSTEVLTSVEVITENYFDKNHPAGSSMNSIDRVGMYIRIMPGDYILWSRGQNLQGPGWQLGLGSAPYDTKKASLPNAAIRLTMEGFPEKAGEYPMTLKVTMNGGEKVLERQFIIKYVDKK